MKLKFKIRDRVYFQYLVYLFATGLLILYATGCEKRFRESQFLMSTIVEITAVGNERDCQRAMKLAFEEIKRIDKLMNVYSKDSDLSRVNGSAGKSAAQVSADTLEVVNQSFKISRITDGAFDISVFPLMELWGFGVEAGERESEKVGKWGSERVGKWGSGKVRKWESEKVGRRESGEVGEDLKQIPSDVEIEAKLPLVDYKKIIVDEGHSTIRLESPGMKIDLGGIAKGYAVDKAIQVLKRAGIQSALVNAGGDIYAMGSPPRKSAWRIGIRHPRRNGELLGMLELKDRAIVTSGDYENYFEVNGKRYCHIMDPGTGRPVEGIMSVTIVAETATEADALATAVFPLGADKGMKLIEGLKGVEGIIVTGDKAELWKSSIKFAQAFPKLEDNMRILVSGGMKGKIRFVPK